MGLLDTIKQKLFGVTFGGPGASSFISEQDWMNGLPVTGTTAIEMPYAQHPSVCIAVRTIAEDAASVCWELYPDGADPDADKIEEHPLLDLWNKPNSTMTGSDLWVASYTYFKLTGECFWYYPGLTVGTSNGLRANRRSTGEIALLDPYCVSVERKDGVVAYKYRVNGVDQPLESDYLTHFRRFNPYSPLRGLSELASLLLELDVDWNAATWNKRFFGDQNGIPTGLLKPPIGAILPSEDREGYLKQFNSRHSRKRGVGIIPGGWEWQDVGGSPRDMEFKDMREFSREQILAVYGVPPFMAGVLDKANYANAREQRATYWNGTITRMLSYFQGVLNYDFMPKVGLDSLEVWPDLESVKALTEDLVSKSAIAQTLFNMGFPKSVINERLDLGMMVDDLVDADIGYLPISMIPVDMVEEAHTPVAPVAPDPNNQDKPNGDATKSYRKLAPGGSRRESVWRSIVYRTRDLEAKFEKAIRKHFREIETEVLGQLNSLKGWNLVQGVEKADDSYLFDMQFAKGKLMRMVVPLYDAAIERGGTAVLTEIDYEQAFDKLSPNVASKVAELTRKITRIDDTVERQLRESLVDGLRSGEGVSQLTKRIESIMSTSKVRASTIARTETGGAFTFGRVEGERQAGVQKHQWLTAHDEHVRDGSNGGANHVVLDGQIRSLDEAFDNGLMYPLQPGGMPDEVINCRCTVVPVIGEANV